LHPLPPRPSSDLLAISAPRSRSTKAISYWPWRSSQNCALLPKYRPSRTAVSAVIERRPLRISVTRPDGTPRSSASRLALSFRSAISRLKRRPGCAAGGMSLSSVVVHDLYVVGITLAEIEAYAPGSVHAHGPLVLPVAF